MSLTYALLLTLLGQRILLQTGSYLLRPTYHLGLVCHLAVVYLQTTIAITPRVLAILQNWCLRMRWRLLLRCKKTALLPITRLIGHRIQKMKRKSRMKMTALLLPLFPRLDVNSPQAMVGHIVGYSHDSTIADQLTTRSVELGVMGRRHCTLLGI